MVRSSGLRWSLAILLYGVGGALMNCARWLARNFDLGPAAVCSPECSEQHIYRWPCVMAHYGNEGSAP